MSWWKLGNESKIPKIESNSSDNAYADPDFYARGCYQVYLFQGDTTFSCDTFQTKQWYIS